MGLYPKSPIILGQRVLSPNPNYPSGRFTACLLSLTRTQTQSRDFCFLLVGYRRSISLGVKEEGEREPGKGVSSGFLVRREAIKVHSNGWERSSRIHQSLRPKRYPH